MGVRIGTLGLVNRTFPGDMDRVHARFEQDMREMAREMDFEVSTAGKPFDRLADVEAWLGELERQSVDFLMIQLCAISSGTVMETIAKSGIPLGLWGLPEPAAEGPVQLNSLCGLTMFCSIIKTHLRGVPIRYKWFYGERKDRQFQERFQATIRSLKTVKRLKGAKIGIVGGIAPGFLNVYADRREIQRRFSVEVAEYEFSDLRRLIEATPVDAAIRQLAATMAAEVDGVSDDVKGALELHAVVHESLKKFAADNSLDSLAVSCWPRFRTELGIMPCAAYARLTDNGLITACEGDLEGVLGMRILQSLAGGSAMIMDFTDVDREAGMIQYWHCGNAPLSCGQPGTVRLEPHFKPGSRVTCGDSVKVGMSYDLSFKPGEYTVCRLMDDGSRCLVFSGEMMENPRGTGFDGTRGWLGRLRFEGIELPLPDLLETIMSEGVPHHHCLVRGNVVSALTECMRWFGVKVIRPIRYGDSARFDTVPGGR